MNIQQLAINYRQLVLWFGMQLLISLVSLVFGLPSMMSALAILVTIVALAFYAFRTAEALGSSTALLWGVAMLVPCVNAITLLVLSAKANEACRANGVAVGLFGPRI